ncbi:MAG: M48 family metalloprotease [Bacteroidota bacterium]
MLKVSFVKVLFFCTLLMFTMGAKAQFSADYTPLKSTGTLPAEFLKTARALSKEDLSKNGYGKDRMAKQQFIISSNYVLNNLLLSGSVLINDPLGEYVNKVADEVLKNDPELRKKFHFYVTKSPEVNAHAFDGGFIFINVGLLAQLENEAQLAFVLAHEITHIVKKHSVNAYVERTRLDNGTSDYDEGSYETRNLAKYRFSQENESEADVEGLNMLRQTNYSVKTVNGAFDVLQYSYLPFELVDFKKSFFEDRFLILPDTVFLKKTSEVKSNDDYDDSKSTHPNIRKRRAAIEAQLKVNDEAGRKKYLLSEEQFKKCRETARFEICRLYLLDRDYVNAIYASYILLEKYPDNVYLKKTIARALYNITVNKSTEDRNLFNKEKNDSELSSKEYKIPDYSGIEGESQRLYYMLENLTSKELNTVALAYTYRAHKAHPDDYVLKMLTDSLFSEMVNANHLYPGNFSLKTKLELKDSDTVKAINIDTTAEVSKYSKIKKQQEKVEINTDENFIKYAFVSFLKEKEFEESFYRATHGLTNRVEKEEVILSVSERKAISKAKELEAQSKIASLKIESIIFIDPFYMKINAEGRDEIVNYFESEDKQVALLEIEKKCAEQLHLNYEMLTTRGIAETDIEKYNNNALLNDWLVERFSHGDNADELESGAEEVKELINKLGSKYVVWAGVFNKKGRVYRNKYFFMVFNIENGEIVKFETRFNKGRDNIDLITSFVYSSLFNLVKS